MESRKHYRQEEEKEKKNEENAKGNQKRKIIVK